MAENSKIEWTDHTFNPWVGCTKVSPGCDHCYAEAWAERYGQVEWGRGAPRKLTSDANWRMPVKWDRQAQAAGIRMRVFCASLADVFDNEVDPLWRARLWNLIKATPHLDWLLLTKRIGNAVDMLPWTDRPWQNVWLGASIVNQQEADRDIPKLLATPAAIHFLSMEPLLGAVTIRPYTLTERPCPVCSLADETKKARKDYSHPINCGWRHDQQKRGKLNKDASFDTSGIDWIIVGGESGKDARPMHPDWVRSLRDQCMRGKTAFFFKQWGEWGVNIDGGDNVRSCFLSPDGTALDDVFEVNKSECVKPCLLMFRDGKHRTGREIDGQEWNKLPRPLLFTFPGKHKFYQE